MKGERCVEHDACPCAMLEKRAIEAEFAGLLAAVLGRKNSVPADESDVLCTISNEDSYDMTLSYASLAFQNVFPTAYLHTSFILFRHD
jgi:hypothetical protein